MTDDSYGPLPDRALRKLLSDARSLLPGDEPAPPDPDRYRIREELGRGGAGVVYLADDLTLERPVAIKLLRDSAVTDERAWQRFQQEAKLVARLSHPHIATLYEANESFLVMQYVPGETLATFPREDRRALVRLMRDAARAVDFAHREGIVHRDLKPHNLMVGDGDHLFVMDFGLAKQTAVDARVSVSGHVLGTPAYMSPEQAQGKAQETGEAADVYGLGATLYELLADRPPFEGEDVYDVLRQVVEKDPAPLSASVDRDLRTIVARCLEKDPARRYPSAAELASDLDRWLAGETIHARSPSVWYRMEKFAARRKAILGVVLVAVVFLGAVVVFAVSRVSRERDVSEGRGQALELWQSLSRILADAELYDRGGDPDRASQRLREGLQICEDSLALDADFASAHFFRGRLQRRLGETKAARASLDRALELDPSLGEAHFERGMLFVAEYRKLLQKHRELYGSYEGAATAPVHEYDRFETFYPYFGMLRKQAIVDLSVEVGQSSYFRPEEARYGQAELRRLQGEREEARRELEQVVEDDPFHAPALVSLARMALEENDLDRAVEFANLAVERHAGHAPAYEVRSRACSLQSRGEGLSDERVSELRELALVDIDRWFSLVSGEAADHVRRGTWRLELGDLGGARVDFDAALKLDDESSLALARRARVSCEQARREDDRDGERALELYANALRDCARALTHDPGRIEAHHQAGVAEGGRVEVLVQQGKRDQAREAARAAVAHFDGALRLFPTFTVVQEDRKKAQAVVEGLGG